MTTLQATSRFPVAPVVLAGVGAQFVDDALYAVFPPAAVLAPLSALLAVVLTAAAARLVTRRLGRPAAPRAGLVVGAVSAGAGLAVSGLGLVTLVIAALTLVAGVAGAVAGRQPAIAWRAVR
jgi:hypothetical protein